MCKTIYKKYVLAYLNLIEYFNLSMMDMVF